MSTQPECCQATRLDEAASWLDAQGQVQDDRDSWRHKHDMLQTRFHAMLALHCGFSEGGNQMRCCGGCGPWPCPSYLAAYPEAAWTEAE